MLRIKALALPCLLSLITHHFPPVRTPNTGTEGAQNTSVLFFLFPFSEIKIISTGFRTELASSERITAVGAEDGKTHGTFLQHGGFFFVYAAEFAFQQLLLILKTGAVRHGPGHPLASGW